MAGAADLRLDGTVTAVGRRGGWGRVALPRSAAALDEAFVGELGRLFGYWTTGADIGPPRYRLADGRVRALECVRV
jgi:hypothetical protein